MKNGLKRFLFVGLSIILSIGLSGFAAVPSEAEAEIAARREAQRYAYMDLESAPEHLKEKILAAREEMIYRYCPGWSANGWECAVIDLETGEVIRRLPDFYDLFPKDWEIPKEEVNGSIPELKPEPKSQPEIEENEEEPSLAEQTAAPVQLLCQSLPEVRMTTN